MAIRVHTHPWLGSGGQSTPPSANRPEAALAATKGSGNIWTLDSGSTSHSTYPTGYNFQRSYRCGRATLGRILIIKGDAYSSDNCAVIRQYARSSQHLFCTRPVADSGR